MDNHSLLDKSKTGRYTKNMKALSVKIIEEDSYATRKEVCPFPLLVGCHAYWMYVKSRAAAYNVF